VSKEKNDIQAQLFVVEFSLFDTVTNSTAFISEKELRADLNFMLFGQYPVKATVEVQQVTSWEKASLFIAGTVKSTENNIPSQLEFYIKEHLEMLYDTSNSKIRNAKAVYTNSKLQQQSSLKNNLALNIRKAKTDMQFQIVSTDLENQRKIVSSIEDELQKANDKTQELQKMINNHCMIERYEEICIPREQCSECVQNISTLLQSQCSVPCTDPVKIVEIVGYKMESRYKFVPRVICKTRKRCYLSVCITHEECETRSICTRVTYLKVIYEEKEIEDPNRRCTKTCPQESILIPISSECCTLVGCTRKQDDNCTRKNKQCSRSRRIIYKELARSQNANAVILQSYDGAKENETALRLKVEQLRIRKIVDDQRYNDSYKILSESNLAVYLASAAYEKIQNETNIDQFQKFQTSRNAKPMFDSLKIKSMTFNATLVSDSPKVLQMVVVGNIESDRFTFAQTIAVDFNILEGSLRNAAAEIVKDTISGHKSKRSLRSRHESTEQSNINHYKFQGKCTDLQNIIESNPKTAQL